MIRLTEVLLKNYRSVIDTSFEIPENPAALIGVNGAGKTNVLSALTVLRDGLNTAYRYTFLSDSKNDDEEEQSTVELLFITNPKTRIRIRFDLYFDITKTGNPLSHFEAQYKLIDIKYSRWNKIDYDFFRLFESRRRRHHPVRSSSKYLKMNISDDTVALLLEALEYISGIDYFSATQFSDPAESPVSIELRGGSLSRNYDRTHDHERYLYDMFVNFSSDDTAKERYISIVGKSGLELVEDIDFQEIEIPSDNVRVLAGGRVKTISTKRTIVIPIFTVDGLTLSPSQLSEGTFKTLALTYYIINSPSELLLIEEPEVGVHHGLLSSIVELIKFKAQEKQIIFSTHSEVVIDQLAPDNILLVEKQNGSTSVSSLVATLSNNDYEALRQYLKTNGNLGDYWRESGFTDE